MDKVAFEASLGLLCFLTLFSGTAAESVDSEPETTAVDAATGLGSAVVILYFFPSVLSHFAASLIVFALISGVLITE